MVRFQSLSTAVTVHESLPVFVVEALLWPGESSRTFYGKRVGGFGDDHPGDEVCYEARATGEKRDHACEDAHEIKIPAVVLRKACAYSGDHAVLSRTRELIGVWVSAHGRRWSGGDCGSARRTETRGGFNLLTAVAAEHGRLPGRDSILP